MRPFKVRYIQTNEVVEHTSFQDIRPHVPFMLEITPDYLDPTSLDKMITSFVSMLNKRINMMANDEHIRVSRIEKEQGKEAALDFVKRTYAVYKKHIVYSRKKTKYYFARDSYIKSVVYFRNYLK